MVNNLEGLSMAEMFFLHPLIYVMAMVAIKNAEAMNTMEKLDK